MKLLLPALALAAGCTHPSAAVLPMTSGAGVVERVVDGDTFVVDGQKVRVLGVDTPETVKPNTPVQCGGEEATAFAHQLLDGRHVTLVADPSQADKDRYQRLLRYVRLDDGRDYSIEAARAGMARNYVYGRKRVQEQDQIEAAETDARTAGRGLWSHC